MKTLKEMGAVSAANGTSGTAVPRREATLEANKRFGGRAIALPALVACGVALVVMLAAGLAFSGRDKVYVARGSVVILPDASNQIDQASLFDTLGRGGLPETFARVMSSAPVSSAPAGSSASAKVVPSTVIIDVEGRGPGAAAAERIAQLKIDAGVIAVRGLDTPYVVSQIESPSGTAVVTGASALTLLAAAALVSIVLGLAAGRSVFTLGRVASRTTAG